MSGLRRREPPNADERLADAVARGLKRKEHDDRLHGTGCVGILVLFFALWGLIAVVLGGGAGAVVVGLLVALGVCFWLGWRLTDRYYR